MKCEFKGILRGVLPSRTYGAKHIVERVFMCEEIGSGDILKGYPNLLAFSVKYDPTSDKNDDTDDILAFHDGDLIQFSFFIRSHGGKNPQDNAAWKTELRVASKILPITISATKAAPQTTPPQMPKSCPPE